MNIQLALAKSTSSSVLADPGSLCGGIGSWYDWQIGVVEEIVSCLASLHPTDSKGPELLPVFQGSKSRDRFS